MKNSTKTTFKVNLFILFVAMLFSVEVNAQADGTIIDKMEITSDSLLNSFSNIKIMEPERFVRKTETGLQWTDEWKFIQELNMYKITYLSDGLKVIGYLYEPKASGKYPCIISNRGGNREFAMWSAGFMAWEHKELLKSGYVVIASNYRGVDGGEGMEEFGGEDVNDVLNLIPILEQNPKADTSAIGMYGWSRGSMMSFLALKATDRIKAMAVGGLATDLRDETRPEMETLVYAELIPDYWKNKEEELDKRSAIKWVDKLPKNVPIT